MVVKVFQCFRATRGERLAIAICIGGPSVPVFQGDSLLIGEKGIHYVHGNGGPSVPVPYFLELMPRSTRFNLSAYNIF